MEPDEVEDLFTENGGNTNTTGEGEMKVDNVEAREAVIVDLTRDGE